ncbi:hypothetical protein PV728_18380 [Streptomyces europaeiscabiei]|uniref:hypothetical protein n=1 Tax=Streptomyces europaeiscabiei TaxID=146819 RepID=UPI0029B2113E|nr:hypothetical protein [Streptomyces europaeiscabiei]MDX3632211.1 hypothetical protein [Streptomyces europaeiscabiei]MDX3649696.1 hypothetical protein [Streptomyces europaeiscabiei]
MSRSDRSSCRRPFTDRDAVRIVLQVIGQVMQERPQPTRSSTSPGLIPHSRERVRLRPGTSSSTRIPGRETAPTKAAVSSLPATSSTAPSPARPAGATAA